MRFLSFNCVRSAIIPANGACSPALISLLYSEKYSLRRSASWEGRIGRLFGLVNKITIRIEISVKL